MTSLIRRRLAQRGDAGFSLIEATVSLVIAALIFSALSVALLQTMKASTFARQNQNAADLLNKQIEYVRSLDFSAATELTNDLVGDSNLTLNGGTYYLTTSAGQEPVVAGTVGLIPQHIQTVVVQKTSYTVATYVTKVTDTTNAAANYRRVTVIATWTVNGQVHTRRSSSFFTDTRRGLPLPRFTMGTAATYKTNVGATLALPVRITNVGAPDAFNLSATVPASGGTWTWYYDSNGDGVYTSADSALSDTDGNGAIDTGILQPGQSILAFAVRVIASGEDTTQSVLFTAVSAAQPSASTASQSFTDQVLVNPASCTGCTLTTYYLHNGSAYSDTAYQGVGTAPMPFDKTAPASTRTGLYNYSTDCTGSTDCGALLAGRHIRAGGGAAETDKTKVAPWYYQVPNNTCLKGTASITVWVRAADGGGAATTLTAYIGSDQNNNWTNGSNFTAAGSGTATLAAATSGSWQPVTIGVPITSNLDSSGSCAGAFSTSKYLVIRVVAGGTTNVRIAYDTTAFPAQALLPVTAGG
jgi:type II secretory pathway pseudopilin PulG